MNKLAWWTVGREIVENRSGSALYFAAAVSLGGFLFGFDATVISGVIGFVSQEFSLNDWQLGLVVGAPTLTGIVGAVTTGPLADRYGRKRILQFLALLYAISALLSAFAPDYISLVIARGIGGYAFASLGIAPLYIAETSPAKLRGRLVSVNQLNIVVGFSAAYFANYYILQASQGSNWVAMALQLDQHAWRWMLGIEALPAIAYFLLLNLVPESPRWLYRHGRHDEAKAVLARILPTERQAQAFENIRLSFEHTEKGLWELLGEILSPKMRLVIFLGLTLGIVQQVTGINAIYFYAPTIFEQAGVGTNAAFAQAIWIGIFNIIFTFVSMALIDRLGRRPLMLIGLIGVVISMSICSYSFQQARYSLNQQEVEEISAATGGDLAPIAGRVFESDVAFKTAAKDLLGDQVFRNHEADILAAAMSINAPLLLAGILGFVASFAVSLGPVMWVLLSEIFPNHLRAVAMAFVGLFNSIVSFAVQFLFPVGLTTIGAAGTFAIYGGLSMIGFILLYKYMPETKGKTLEQLGNELTRTTQENQLAATQGETA